MMNLHYADYIVFGGLLLISALVGPFYMWRDRNRPATSESYFLGNRGLHIIPTAASLFASFWSAISLVGIPAELYTGGAKFFMSSVGQAIGIAIAAFVVVPVIYKLKLISSYEYFELRFKSRLLRKIGTVTNVFAGAFYLAVATFAPCIALEAVSPIPLWASAIATTAITMIYTVLGGIKAVVLVDLIQALVMFGGIIVAIVIGFMKIDGGFTRAMEIAYHGGRLDFFDFDPNPTNTYNFWVTALPPILSNAGIYATSQAAVQRFSALPTVRQATWSVMSLAPQIIFLKVLLFLLSIAMFAHYDSQGCDPLRGKIITSPNQLTTFYIADILHYPGMVGIWFAALFSGSLSTMSTGYNSVAACIWEDLLKERLQHRLSPRGVSHVLKLISLLLGILSCILAISFKFLTGSVVKLSNSTVSIFGSALYIAFFCGGLFPFVTATGTMFGMVIATICLMFMSGGQLLMKLGNEQISLPTKTANCSAMVANLIASGKFRPVSVPNLMSNDSLVANGSNLTSMATALATGTMLLTSSSPLPALPTSASLSPALAYADIYTNSTSLFNVYPAQGSGFLPAVEEIPLLPDLNSTAFPALNNPFILANSSADNISNATLAQPIDVRMKGLPPALFHLFSVSYLLFPLLSLAIGLSVAIIISLCTGGCKLAKYVHPKYLIVPNCFYKGDYKEEEKDDDGNIEKLEANPRDSVATDAMLAALPNYRPPDYQHPNTETAYELQPFLAASKN